MAICPCVVGGAIRLRRAEEAEARAGCWHLLANVGGATDCFASLVTMRRGHGLTVHRNSIDTRLYDEPL